MISLFKSGLIYLIGIVGCCLLPSSGFAEDLRAEAYPIDSPDVPGVSMGSCLDVAVLPPALSGEPFDSSRWHQELSWRPAGSDTPNLGFMDESVAARFVLRNQLDQPVDVTVEVEFPLLDYVTLYAVADGEVFLSEAGGDHIDNTRRSIIHRNFLFPVTLPPETDVTLYFEVSGKDAIQLPVKLWTTSEFIEHESTELLILGGYLGIMLAMFGYNFFLWITIRQQSYLFYILHVASLSWALASQKGISTLYLFPHNLYWSEIQVPVSVFLTDIFAMLFAYSFLRVRENLKRLGFVMRAAVLVLTIVTVLAFFMPYRLVIFLSIILSLLSIVLVVIVVTMSIKRGVPSARLYLLGWGGHLIGTAVVFLGRINVIPPSAWTENGVFLGSSVEVVLFSLALANRISEERKQRVRAQQDALEKERLINQKNQELQELELARKEEELKQRTAELESRQERENLMVAIAHELRTPLNIVNATLDSLGSDSGADAMQDAISTIRDGANRLTSQTENVILMSDLNRGIQACRREFLVEHLVSDIHSTAQRMLKDKPVAFSVQGIAQVPRRLEGDFYLITRLLAPLIDNACKYTTQGKVEVVFSYDQGILQVRVDDTGPGLPADRQRAIYEPFKQLSAGYTREHEGMGLGLSVASSLAAVMDGKLMLDTTQPRGCHFVLSLPLPVPESAKAPDPTADADTTGNNDSGTTQRILIVEDNKVNAKVLAKLCEKLGYQTALAEDGQKAVDIASRESFSLILMDLQMPVMDGFDATRQLRQMGVSVPIIAVSANADHRSRQNSFAAGMNDFVSKPVKKETLNVILAHYHQ